MSTAAKPEPAAAKPEPVAGDAPRPSAIPEPPASAPVPPEHADAKQGTDSAEPPQPGSPGAVARSPMPPPPATPVASVNITAEMKAEFVDSDLRRASVFSSDLGLPFSQTAEIAGAEMFFYDVDFVAEALSVLGSSRTILLAGEPGCGKESMARYLACRLREDGSLERDTLVFPPLSSDVGINLLASIRAREDLRGRTLVFRDALERNNGGLRDFLLLLAGGGEASIAENLREVNSYLIFTVTASSLPAECAGISSRLKHAIPPLSRELLDRAIEAHLTRFRKQCSNLALAAKIDKELRKAIAEEAGTVPRAVRFITVHLMAVLREEITLQNAFQDLNDACSWFLAGAATETEAWIYAVALILAQSPGPAEDVPWGEFTVFHNAIRDVVFRWRGRKPPARPLDERWLQSRAGIEINRDPSYARHVVAFRDPAAARRLWNMLLTAFRSLAGGLVPALLELTHHDSVSVRARAAQALGVIGSMDAKAMTVNWFRQWSESRSFRQKALAGYAAQGAFAMKDAEYRRFVVDTLDRLQKDETLTAVAAWKQIASLDLPLAMSKLKGIAESHLGHVFDNLGEFLRDLERAVASLGRFEATAVRRALRTFYVQLLDKGVELTEALNYALVSIAITVGLRPVLEALRDWTMSSPGMGALVCIWFLQDGGIAPELTRRVFEVVPMEGDRTESIACNGVVAFLLEDPSTNDVLFRFLQTTYAAAADFFPPDLALSLNRLVFDFLCEWVRDSISKPLCRRAMVELGGRLLGSGLGSLRERTFDWLSALGASDGEMAAFSRDCRRWSLQAQRQAVQ